MASDLTAAEVMRRHKSVAHLERLGSGAKEADNERRRLAPGGDRTGSAQGSRS